MERTFYTTREVAERLGVTVDWVQRLIRNQTLRAERFGHIWLISEENLERFHPKPAGRPKTKGAIP